MTLVLVAVGGAVGALVRWRLATLNGERPTGTLVANAVGGAIAGLVLGLTDSPALRLLLVVGVAGGMTTFSTLVVEAATRPPGPSMRYLIASIAVGLAAVLAGMAIGGALAG